MNQVFSQTVIQDPFQKSHSCLQTKDYTSNITQHQNRQCSSQKKLEYQSIIEQLNRKNMEYDLLKSRSMQFIQKNYLFYKTILKVISNVNGILQQLDLQFSTAQQIYENGQNGCFVEDNTQIMMISNYLGRKFKRIFDFLKDYKEISQYHMKRNKSNQKLTKKNQSLTKINQQLMEKLSNDSNNLKIKINNLEQSYNQISVQLEKKKTLIEESENIQLDLIKPKNQTRQRLQSLVTHLIRRIKSHQSICDADKLQAEELNNLLTRNYQIKISQPKEIEKSKFSDKDNQKTIIIKNVQRSVLSKKKDKQKMSNSALISKSKTSKRKKVQL